jgi:hypothetical protein
MNFRLWVISAWIVALSLAACAASHVRDEDGGPRGDGLAGQDASACAAGAEPLCVYCGGDAVRSPRCEGGAWICPDGTMPRERCPPTCLGPPRQPDCTCDFDGPRPMWICPVAECGPGVEGLSCGRDGEICGECCPLPSGPSSSGPLVCERGRWSGLDCGPCPLEPRSCPVVRPIGGRCVVEGQLCGDPCCDTATICRRGAWAPGPIADYDACTSYACGPGTCRSDEACASLGCPGDEQCLPIPSGCSGCECVELPLDARCVERDGHLFITGGDCA